MYTLDYLRSDIESMKGKTIAVVYIFEGENAPGFSHYWIWKSNIISGWLKAIQELACMPLIMDVRTFAQKAMDRSLPHVDFVLNLNCGSYELSSMSLVPSICSFIAVPCIPCNAVSIVASENKLISNLLASAMGIHVPSTLLPSSTDGIYRPLNLGSSIGVKRGPIDIRDEGTGVYQQFIPGYDVTFPIVYNPCLDDIDLLTPILYLPKELNPNWIYDEKEKILDNGFITLPIQHIDKKLKASLLSFARVFPIQTFGRIDARLKSKEETLSESIVDGMVRFDDLYFIEMNSMPTIEPADSFEYSIEYTENDNTHYFSHFARMYKEITANPTVNGILLLCSMLSLARAKC